MDLEQKKKAAYLRGIIVLVVLTILTGLEFWVASAWPVAIIALFVIAILKAAPILQYFMHMSSLWSEEEGH